MQDWEDGVLDWIEKLVEPEDNVGRAVCKDFQLEKTSAAHGSRRVDAVSDLRRESAVPWQLELPSALFDFPSRG